MLTLLAICRSLTVTGDAPPEWIELIPAGQLVTGVDGRQWKNSRPDLVAQSLNKAALGKIPLDWEHATEIKAPKGEPAPAAGWIVELQVRDGGSIWARVEWNKEGAADVVGKRYSGISPAFAYDPLSLEILRLVSAGLTNKPNLHVSAINRSQNEAEQMRSLLVKLLKLADSATDDDIVAALNTVLRERDTALNAAKNPPVEQFVPVATYQLALNRATSAENKLVERDQAELKKDAEAALDTAISKGHVAPANRDYFMAQCSTREGIDKFKAFYPSLPVIAANSSLGGRQPPGTGKRTLTPEQKAICAAQKISEEEYLAVLEAEAA